MQVAKEERVQRRSPTGRGEQASGVVRAITVTLVAALLAVSASAREATVQELDAANVESFLDEVLPRHLDAHAVPGAAVSVVAGGEILAAWGYGVADLATGRAVTADTPFRVASITKLFTFTAVMQLVEEGRLDLDANVNDYLVTTRVPDRFGAPITLRHLLTHTAGFEDLGIGTARFEDPGPDALQRYLAEHLPARVRPPGEVIAYSNHGAALAGLILSDVSGRPWDAVVSETVLEPLAMARTTLDQPPRGIRHDELARSYLGPPDEPRATTFVIDLLAPAGGASSTAHDMALFMLGQLGQPLGGAQVLGPEARALMHAGAFTMHPEIDGRTLGFQERTLRGLRTIVQDGAYQGYVSLLVLVPELDVGLFAVFNSPRADAIIDDLLSGFADRFLPTAVRPAAAATPLATAPAPDPTGVYRPARRPFTTIETLTRHVPLAHARPLADGSLALFGRAWVRVGERLYQDASGDRLAVLVDADGRVNGIAVGAFVLDRVPFYARPELHLGLALGAALVFAATTFMAAFVTRRLSASQRSHLGRAAGWSAGTGVLAILIGWVGIVAVVSTTSLFTHVPPILGTFSWLPVLGAALGAAALVLLAIAWARGSGHPAQRVLATLLVVSCAVLVALSHTYGVLGPNLG